jgi:hypothetical protein
VADATLGFLRYLAQKIRAAWRSGNLGERARRHAITRARRPIEILVRYAGLAASDRKLDVANGFRDHRGSALQVPSQPQHLERIRAAYLRAKEAERSAGAPYRVRGLWREWLDINYRPLVDALRSGEREAFARLLENHYREPFTIGAGGYDSWVRYRSLLGPAYIRCVWAGYRDRLAQLGFDLGRLRFPCIGNPAGVLFNGSVVPIDTLRHAYHATEVARLLRGVERPLIAEIGGGLGGQALQTISQRADARYVIFDLPEVGVLSSYLLLTAFPDKAIRLFGEARVTDEFDIAVMPHFAVEELADRSVDLFYNSCSFSEMDAAAAAAYLAVIERACRRYFLHDNHDLELEFEEGGGSVSRNLIGSALVPDPRRFRRLFKKPRAHRLPEDWGIPHFEYLYELTPE